LTSARAARQTFNGLEEIYALSHFDEADGVPAHGAAKAKP